MGEVYRARDAKLQRDVALKMLSDAVVGDPDRLARFRREAQVLASLNHPSIAAIYGFEDSGATHALVLELVEGQTLAELIAQGPMALGEALPLAKQIASATAAPRATAEARGARRSLVWAWAAIAIGSLAVAAFTLWNRPANVQPSSVRLTIPLPPGSEITSSPAITSDGRTVAYVARQGTEDALLYLRDLGSFETRVVAGSNGARQPFFSPDDKWVAFFAQSQLQKAEVKGGPRCASSRWPILSAARGPRTTRSSTRRRSAPGCCGSLPPAERPSPSRSPTVPPTAMPTCGGKLSRDQARHRP